MSFFIRKNKQRPVSLPTKLTDRANSTSNRKQTPRQNKGFQQNQRKRGAGRPQTDHPPKQSRRDDEEITSESEDEESNVQVSEDENGVGGEEEETEQEARLRIAKEQISQLKRNLIEKHGVANDEDVGLVLREQELVEEGTLLRKVFTEEFREKELEIETVVTGKVIKTPLTCIRSTPTTIYASTKSGVIVSYNMSTRTRTTTTLTPPPVTSLAVSTTHVAASTNSSIHLLSPTDLSITHTFRTGRNAMSLSISTDTLFSTHKDRTVKLWNLQERAYVESLFGHQDIPTCVDVLHSNRIVTTGGFDKTLRVWKIDEESQLVYNWDQDIIDVVKVLSGGYFVAGGCSGDIALFSFGRKKPLSTIACAHGSDSNSVPRWITSLGGIGDFIASGSDNGVVKIWRVVSRKIEFVRDVLVPDGVIVGIEVIADSETVKLVVGVGTEHKSGRWGGRKSNCSKIVVVK